MKKLRIELTVLILVIFVFWGTNGMTLSNYTFITKIVCAFAACIDVFMLSVSYEAYKSGKNEESQDTINILLSEQKRIDELFSKFEQSVKELVSNLSIEATNRSVEQNNIILEFLQNLKEENANVFGQAMDGIDKSLQQETKSRKIYFEKLEKQLLEAIQGLKDVQNRNTDTVVEAIESSKVLYGASMEEIKKMKQIQERLVSMEEQAVKLNEEVLANINDAITGFVQVSESVKDQVSALKAYTIEFTKKIIASMTSHYQDMNDRIEDGIEALEDILKEHSDKQTSAYDDQTKSLVECIELIEVVINKSIGEAMKRNDQLVTYIEKVQDEWTSLNKDEIEFLNRIWEER